jgi:hypothetical protein
MFVHVPAVLIHPSTDVGVIRIRSVDPAARSVAVWAMLVPTPASERMRSVPDPIWFVIWYPFDVPSGNTSNSSISA